MSRYGQKVQCKYIPGDLTLAREILVWSLVYSQVKKLGYEAFTSIQAHVIPLHLESLGYFPTFLERLVVQKREIQRNELIKSGEITQEELELELEREKAQKEQMDSIKNRSEVAQMVDEVEKRKGFEKKYACYRTISMVPCNAGT